MPCRYRCIKTFLIDIYDEDGFYNNKSDFVEVGTIWERDEFNNMLGSDIRLVLVNGNNNLNWLEISQERFTEYFKLIKE